MQVKLQVKLQLDQEPVAKGASPIAKGMSPVAKGDLPIAKGILVIPPVAKGASPITKGILVIPANPWLPGPERAWLVTRQRGYPLAAAHAEFSL